MSNYHGVYRSNRVRADSDAIKALLKTPSDPAETDARVYELDGRLHEDTTDDGADAVWFGSTATTFDVWDAGYAEKRTEEFLNELASYIEEPLYIRSVGHTELRHVPDAWQWIVHPDGRVESESLSSPP